MEEKDSFSKGIWASSVQKFSMAVQVQMGFSIHNDNAGYKMREVISSIERSSLLGAPLVGNCGIGLAYMARA